MKNLIVVIVLLFSCMSFLTCGNDNGEVSVKDVANNICKCTNPVVEINVQLEKLQEEGKVEEITTLMSKAGEAMDKAVTCSKNHINENIKKEELRDALTSACDMNKILAEGLIETLFQ